MAADIDAVLTDAAKAHPTPGFVAGAVKEGKTVYRGAFGSAHLKGETPIRTDAVFRIASMTKAVTAVAAMQLVEQGRIDLDAPLGAVIPILGERQVLEGFGADGQPRLRPAKAPVTLRNLLTHTSGFGYDIWNAELLRYVGHAGLPGIGTGLNAALELPLMFDPGEKWEYGIGIDWAGKVVEAVSGQTLDAYMAEHIFAPLGMVDTGFQPTGTMAQRLEPLATRQEDGGMAPMDLPNPPAPEFCSGGGGLLSTLDDYLAFLQMVLHGGTWNGARVLEPETLALMSRDHIGEVPLRKLPTAVPFLSRDLSLQTKASAGWGLSWIVGNEAGPDGRGAGALAWAGLFNTYYWVDPAAKLAGVWMTQILPFEDPQSLAVFGAFERAVYDRFGA
jgi:CubicO group peptidase (beta-lactamase class C family)